MIPFKSDIMSLSIQVREEANKKQQLQQIFQGLSPKIRGSVVAMRLSFNISWTRNDGAAAKQLFGL